jgi:hypothetical protein
VDTFWEETDAAAEQLYDELMARTWALHAVRPSPVTDVHQRDVAVQLAEAAARYVGELRRGSAPAGQAVRALLWPSASVPAGSDPWWATPLGALLRQRRAQLAPTVRSTSPRSISHLVAS